VRELRTQSKAEKSPKYRNVAQVVDGYRFGRTRQAERYLVLRAMQQRGEISDLRCEPAWRIEVNGVLICDYVADFSYRRAPIGLVVEDVKSVATKTPAYRLKRKLLLALHRIRVEEVE
jgi:hypothetical protein